MDEQVVAVTKQEVLTPDLVRGLLIAAVVLLAALVLAWRLGMLAAGIGFVFIVAALLVLAWRRYLRQVSLDATAGLITARSILPLVSFSMPLASLESIDTVRPFSPLVRKGPKYNLVLRRRGRIQPLLFEVWTAREDETVQLLLSLLPGSLLTESARPGTVMQTSQVSGNAPNNGVQTDNASRCR